MEAAEVKSVVIFRAGLLGDTLAGVPALWALKEAYPNARITYVWQHIRYGSRVKAEDILAASGLVDDFERYDIFASGVKTGISSVSLFLKLARRKWDLAIVLEEPHWSSRRSWLARALRPKQLVIPDGKSPRFLTHQSRKGLARTPFIADILVEQLRPLGIHLPGPGAGRIDVNLQSHDFQQLNHWLKGLSPRPPQKRWIGVGPWSNMPVKRWPIDRYAEVVKQLIAECDVVPFVLGGADEGPLGERLVAEWGRGYSACGKLGIREGIALLSRCALYLGNDTGVMHMAASAGIPCVAVFCSHEAPGRWEPYGKNHTVFRTLIDCEGCLLRECVERKMECILSVSPEAVLQGCRRILLH